MYNLLAIKKGQTTLLKLEKKSCKHEELRRPLSTTHVEHHAVIEAVRIVVALLASVHAVAVVNHFLVTPILGASLQHT